MVWVWLDRNYIGPGVDEPLKPPKPPIENTGPEHLLSHIFASRIDPSWDVSEQIPDLA